MRQITEFIEMYKTLSGELRKDEWYEKLHIAIIAEGETELFMKIKEHCRVNALGFTVNVRLKSIQWRYWPEEIIKHGKILIHNVITDIMGKI